MTNEKLISAATIILIKEDEGDTLKILLVKRNPKIKFAGGNFAFPGGKIAPIDREMGKDMLQSAKFAAIRECFEEVGILPTFVNQAMVFDDLTLRDKTNEDSIMFAKILEDYCQNPPLDALVPISRWRPPKEVSPKFDTFFFVYKLNSNIDPIIDGNEIVDAVWISPKSAIELFKAGQMQMLFPTIITLHLLAKFTKFAEITNFANWENPPIIQTQSETIETKTYQFIDRELGYPLYHAAFLH